MPYKDMMGNMPEGMGDDMPLEEPVENTGLTVELSHKQYPELASAKEGDLINIEARVVKKKGTYCMVTLDSIDNPNKGDKESEDSTMASLLNERTPQE